MSAGLKFQRVLGIEMSHSKVMECMKVIQQFSEKFPESICNVIEGNFLESSWEDFDVVYTCSTCYASDQMDRLLQQFKLLNIGAKLILVDKQLKSELIDAIHPVFRQIGSCQCKTSWGTADIYIYIKTS
jgi:hypothetical protein